MAGRHSKWRGVHARIPEQRQPRQAGVADDVRIPGWWRWRRSSGPAAIPAPRLPGIELVDALTKLAHVVSPDELVTGHQRGEFVALCGVRFLAASLAEPGRNRCGECAR